MQKLITNLLLIIGILLILYPFIGKIVNHFNQTIVISKYKKEINSMSDQEKKDRKNQYEAYNENEKSEIDLLNVGEYLGYIEIPKINVKLPIYEGTTDRVLLKGIGHLKNTSLPIGGENTNSVLVGHTGITAKTFFDRLVELEISDNFYIYILDEILQYKISNINVVLPDETENIKPVKGKDIVTLVTCTPKYVNSHRLLVIGERENKISNY